MSEGQEETESKYYQQTIVLLGNLSKEERSYLDKYLPGREIQQVHSGEHPQTTSNWIRSILAIPQSELILVINNAKPVVLVEQLSALFEELGYSSGYDAPRRVDLKVVEVASYGIQTLTSRMWYTDYL